MGSIPLIISFDEIDGFIKTYDKIRYLLLFGLGGMMKFVIGLSISEKSGITVVLVVILQESELIQR